MNYVWFLLYRKTIDFEPKLPITKKSLSSAVYHGCAVKCVFVFEHAFWESSADRWLPNGKLEDLGPIANLFPGNVGTYFFTVYCLQYC